jgi:hypothetical protein
MERWVGLIPRLELLDFYGIEVLGIQVVLQVFFGGIRWEACNKNGLGSRSSSEKGRVGWPDCCSTMSASFFLGYGCPWSLIWACARLWVSRCMGPPHYYHKAARINIPSGHKPPQGSFFHLRRVGVSLNQSVANFVNIKGRKFLNSDVKCKVCCTNVVIFYVIGHNIRSHLAFIFFRNFALNLRYDFLKIDYQISNFFFK